MSNNGSSYQKNGEVTNTGGSTPSNNGGLLGGWKKYAIGAILVAILAAVYLVSSGPSPEATKAAVHKEMTASDLTFDKNGKLKLFDSLSKYYFLQLRGVCIRG